MKQSLRIRRIMLGVGILCAALASGEVHAQRLIVGERAPELKVAEWLTPAPNVGGKLQLVEFFHSTSQSSVARLPRLDALARKYKDRIVVVVIAREPKTVVLPLLTDTSYTFAAGLDDGNKTFTAYRVQFVPFCVLIDGKGRLRWFGNPSELTETIIRSHFNE